MPRSRTTISRWMAATAVIGVDIAVVRAFVLAERRGEHLDLFAFGFFIFFALQFGFWRYLCTAGRRRRFWLGFELAGIAATLAFSITFAFGPVELENWYMSAASELTYHCLPARVDVMLTNEHWDWFLALIYFPPEFAAAASGGLLAVWLSRFATNHSPEHTSA